jgi:hypothetical protein
MLRQLFRRLTGPIGRRLALALLVAVAWAAWTYWPLRPLAAWAGPSDELGASQPSPDGRTLATVRPDVVTSAISTTFRGRVGPVVLYDLATGRERLRLGDSHLTVATHSFSPDGALLGVEDREGGLHVWDATTGRAVAVGLTTSADPHGYRNLAHWNFAFAPDGRTLAFEQPDRRAVTLWDVPAATARATLDGARLPLAFTPDGRTLATGTVDPAARLWDVATGRPLATLGGHTALVGSLAFAPDGRTLATGLRPTYDLPNLSGPTEVKLWAVPGGEPVATVVERPSGANAYRLDFGPHGLLVIRGSGSGLVWDVTATPPRNLDGLIAATQTVSRDKPVLQSGGYPHFSRDGTRLLVPGDEAGTVQLLDAATMAVVATVRLPPLDAESRLEHGWAAFLDGGRLLRAVSYGQRAAWPNDPRGWLDRVLRRNGRDESVEALRLFDTVTGRELVALPSRERGWRWVIPDPDGRGVWTASVGRPGSVDGSGGTARVELWPAPVPGPPWWLWALTAGAAVLALADRGWLRRRLVSGRRLEG